MLSFLAENYQNILFNTARIFSSVFEILLSYLLMNAFFVPKFRNKKMDILPFFFAAAAVIFLQEYKNIGNWKYAVACAILVFILFVLYNGRIGAKIIGSAVFSLTLGLAVVLSSFTYTLISDRFGLSPDVTTQFESLLKLAMSNVFMTVGAVIISTAARRNPNSDTSLSLWLILFTVPAVTLLTFSVYQYYIENYSTDDKILSYLLLSCVGLFAVNIIVFALFRRLQHNMAAKRDTDILKSQLALQEASVINLENAYNRTRAFRHDIKNHILLMDMLAEQEKYDELKSYLKEMSGVIDESSYVRISGISALDAILNEKLYEAQGKNITTNYDVASFTKNNIKPIDMCIILSNALDNAIEANERISDPDRRYIKLKIHGNNTFTVISVSNPTDEKPRKNGENTFITSKKDADNHGFGLKSIENTVNKYKGEMLCKCEDGVFTLVVRLNCI